MVSSLLQWHKWLKKPFISRKSARKSGKANSWLMQTTKTVALCHTGMKNNTIKMHLVHHTCEDILCLPHVASSRLQCFTEFLPHHHASLTAQQIPDNKLYRANPNCQGKPWYDHAMVRWDGFKMPLPARIHTFINLEHLKPNATISFPGSDQGNEPTIPGTYAVIESLKGRTNLTPYSIKWKLELTDIKTPLNSVCSD